MWGSALSPAGGPDFWMIAEWFRITHMSPRYCPFDCNFCQAEYRVTAGKGWGRPPSHQSRSVTCPSFCYYVSVGEVLVILKLFTFMACSFCLEIEEFGHIFNSGFLYLPKSNASSSLAFLHPICSYNLGEPMLSDIRPVFCKDRGKQT